MTSRLRAFPALALALVATALSGCGPDNLVRGFRNPMGFGFCGLVIIVLDVLAIVEVWKSGRSDGDKLLWTLAIVVFPFVGLLAYYFVGRK
jgi:sugar phosphate permease